MPSATMINGLHNRPSSDATKIACQPPADQLKSSEFFSDDASVFSHPTSTFFQQLPRILTEHAMPSSS